MKKDSRILKVKDITVDFDGFLAIQNFDFALNNDQLHFLIGPNGAGKTTLLDVICGKTKISKGTVFLKELHELSRLEEYKIVRQGVGRKFQVPSVFGDLTVFENLEIAMKQDKGLFNILFSKLNNKQELKIEEILELIALEKFRDLKAAKLSHGQKQWLEIGMVLMQEPDLILLDEPIAGMTTLEKEKTGNLLRKIAKNRSVLVVEHDMDFVRKYADKVTVMHQGQLLCQGNVEEVQNDPQVIEVYLGKRGDEDVRVKTA